MRIAGYKISTENQTLSKRDWSFTQLNMRSPIATELAGGQNMSDWLIVLVVRDCLR